MAEHILIGHLLTRTEAARRAGISAHEIVERPDLLRLGGTWLQEVYFEFQFDRTGVRSDLGSVVQLLRKQFDDEAIADWLARPNAALALASPLRWLATGGDSSRLAKAAISAGPGSSNR